MSRNPTQAPRVGRPPIEDRSDVASIPVTARLSPRAVTHLDVLIAEAAAQSVETTRSAVIHQLVLADARARAA